MVEAVVGTASLPFSVRDLGGSPCQSPLCWLYAQGCLLSLGWSLQTIPNLWPAVLYQLPVGLTFPGAVLTPPGDLWHCTTNRSSFPPLWGF